MGKFFSSPKPPAPPPMPELPVYEPPPPPKPPPEMPVADQAAIDREKQKQQASRSAGGRAGTVYDEETLG